MNDSANNPSTERADQFAAAASGTATDAERERLADLLRADDTALAEFVRYMDLHAALRREIAHEADAPRVAPAPASDAPVVPVSAAGVPMYRKGCEPQPFKLRVHHYALAAAALLIACGLAAYLLTAAVDPQPDPVDPNQPGPAVATLIQNTGDLRTPHGYPAEGDDYGRGEYSLSSGRAEFMLTNAVNVRFRGNTRMTMRSDMNVALTRGSAEFVVPKDATGFTVHLPGGSRVVDLGTRFQANVGPDGRSVVSVAEGLVRFDESDAVSHLLVAGQHITQAPGQPWRIVEFATQPGESIIADYNLADSRAPRLGSAPELAPNPLLPVTADERGVTLDRPGQYLTLATNRLHDADGDWMIRIVATPRDIADRTAILVHSGDPRTDGVGLIIVERQWALLVGGVRFTTLAPVAFDVPVDLAIVRSGNTVAVYLDGSPLGDPFMASEIHPASDRFYLGGPEHLNTETFFGSIESLRISQLDDAFDPKSLQPKPNPSHTPVTAEPE